MGIHIPEKVLRVCEPINITFKLSSFSKIQQSNIINMINTRTVRGTGVTSMVARGLLEGANIGYYNKSWTKWKNLTPNDWEGGLSEGLNVALVHMMLDEQVVNHESRKGSWSPKLKESIEEALDKKGEVFDLPWCHKNAQSIAAKMIKLPPLQACKDLTTRLKSGEISEVVVSASKI